MSQGSKSNGFVFQDGLKKRSMGVRKRDGRRYMYRVCGLLQEAIQGAVARVSTK